MCGKGETDQAGQRFTAHGQTDDGSPLWSYRRRWKIERLFAWLGNFRCLVVRYERHALNDLGVVHLGCILILLRQRL
ncbi:MAG TPA: transposase [Ktedonobacterales bacterium]